MCCPRWMNTEMNEPWLEIPFNYYQTQPQKHSCVSVPVFCHLYNIYLHFGNRICCFSKKWSQELICGSKKSIVCGLQKYLEKPKWYGKIKQIYGQILSSEREVGVSQMPVQ